MNHVQRRSPRVLLAVPLRIRHEDRSVEVKTVTVSAHGALVHSPESFFIGADLIVTNITLSKSAKAWVVFMRESDRQKLFDVGFEFLPPAPAFWGSAYRV
jgi:hypothetical protein